ncbi:MAG: ABC transporter permease [Xanthomonadales bacterium]|uniref:ABC transporter permease n=1 Tax=Dokdonella sp. TaxID=2291710 RepID=UPI002C2E03EE|nr:ABC transporter permease [Xanthomonadales bacterium]HQV72466.1 ABC transporter permease [Dokdonella sp.]MBK7012047.1 ABC transporter permease [Xanthomonadales bacterium]MBK7209883.1 ABC transporter permease [Xanthomonadales bacterium]MBL0222541.1 ABC transporter permease [Xanthomonadales bacterium]
MEIRPIFSALMRSKVSMILIGVQVAMTLAIVCNALFIIGQRLDHMNRPSGMNETDTFHLGSSGFGEGFNARATIREDLALIRQLPGVAAVTVTNSVPMSEGGWSTGLSLQPKQKTSTADTAIYIVDDHALDTFDVNLIAGRNFKPEEIADVNFGDRLQPASIIVTKALADKLFPDGDALGKSIYMGEDPPTSTIVGIVDRLQQPWMSSSSVDNSTLVPAFMPYGNSSRYLVRAEPGRRDEVMKLVEQKLADSNTSRIIGKVHTMAETRNDAYSGDRAMAIILTAVIAALLMVTALGIVGMASFWVAQRTRQIGTRRALGASKRDILRYFQTENFIITTFGLLVGAVLAYAFSLWMMQSYQSPRLPWYYVPVGFLCLWALGQLAVLGPAMRASRVPPAVATRSV